MFEQRERNEKGQFVPQNEQEKLEKQIRDAQARLAEIKKAEAEKLAAEKKKAEEEKSAVRKAEVVKVQNAANAYLNLVEENNKVKKSLAEQEKAAYDNYKKLLDDFAAKNKGYHLTYESKDGKTVEFKVEEVRASEFDRIRREQANIFRNFFDIWF